LREYCVQDSINHEPFAELSEVAHALFGAGRVQEPQKNVAGLRIK
jgi:hypothetical protein